jgi:lipopolysaccharide export system protein LptA
MTKGTITLRGDKVVVRVDPEGFQHATVTGNPVRFRQKTDPSQGRPRRVDRGRGAAPRDRREDRSDRAVRKARVSRDQDEVRGDYVMLDQRSEFLSVSGGKGITPSATEGRVRAVIQPKAPPSSAAQPPAAGASPAPAPEKPPAK